MKIIFAGTPRFAVPSLAAILREGPEVLAVYTQPDRPAGRGRRPAISPIKSLALDKNLVVKQPADMSTEAEYIRSTDCDLLVVVAYGVILPQSVLDAPRQGCINVHASILPRWRGAAPIQRAIEAGDKRTGVSIMLMTAGLDTGPVLSVATTEIGHDNAGTIHDRIAKMGAEALIEAIAAISNGTTLPVEQDDALACYANKINKKEAELDWTEPAEVLHRRIRAFNPWPICQTSHEGARIRVWDSKISGEDNATCSAGTVGEIGNGMVVVNCGVGHLGLTRLQREGGKPLATEEFLRGYKIACGDVLGADKLKASGLGDDGSKKT
jgi:methionyl-tRNA formyltransferase